ncbi:MAG TPA: hypothetical protein VJ792_01240 [Candidatus Nitrosotalea sp.]|nr:hypothetical protein [Candidatus Nitrosotalea sp.]
MSEDFEKFQEALTELVKSFELKNLALRVSSDVEHGIVKIYGENASTLERAKEALEEVAELAYDTAEHHPYWNLLYDGSQILKIVLERWHENFSDDELAEIKWYAGKLKDSIANIQQGHHH